MHGQPHIRCPLFNCPGSYRKLECKLQTLCPQKPDKFCACLQARSRAVQTFPWCRSVAWQKIKRVSHCHISRKRRYKCVAGSQIGACPLWKEHRWKPQAAHALCLPSIIVPSPSSTITKHLSSFLRPLTDLGSEWVLWSYPLSRSCLLQELSFRLQNTGQWQRYQRGGYVWRWTLEQ